MANSTPINYNQTRAAFGPPRINPDQSLNISAIENSRMNRAGQRRSSMGQQCMSACSAERLRVYLPQSPPGVSYTERPQNLQYLAARERNSEFRMSRGLFPRTPPRPFYQPEIIRPVSPNSSPFLPQQNQSGLAVPSRGNEYIRNRNRNISPPRPKYADSPRYSPDRFATSHNYGNAAHEFNDSHLNVNISDISQYKNMRNAVEERHQLELNELGDNMQMEVDPERAAELQKVYENRQQGLLTRQNAELQQLKRSAQLANLRKHQFNKRVMEVITHRSNIHSSQTTTEESTENKDEHLNNFKKFSDIMISRMLQKHAQQISELMRDRINDTTDELQNQLMEELKLKQAEELEAIGKDLDDRFKMYMESVENPTIQIVETTRTGPNNEVITERVTTEGGDENGEEDQIIHVEDETPEEISINLSLGNAVTYVLNKQHQLVNEIKIVMSDAMRQNSNNDIKVYYENRIKEVVMHYKEVLMELLNTVQDEYHKQLVAAKIMNFDYGSNACATNSCGDRNDSQNQRHSSNVSQNGVEFGPANKTNHSIVNQSGIQYGPANQTRRSISNEGNFHNGPMNRTQYSISNQNGSLNCSINQSPCAEINQSGSVHDPVNQSPCSNGSPTGVEYGPQNQTQRSTTNQSIVEFEPNNGPVRSERTIRSETVIEYGPENQSQHSNLNPGSNCGVNQSGFGNEAAYQSPCTQGGQNAVQFIAANPIANNIENQGECSRTNQTGVQFNLRNQSRHSMNERSKDFGRENQSCYGKQTSISQKTSPDLRREEYATFRSCLTALFEKQREAINKLKEIQSMEQQEHPGQLLKQKHDFQMKLLQDHNLREFNEIWQMIIQINPTILRKLPPINVPPEIEENARSVADDVESAQSQSNIAERMAEGECSAIENAQQKGKLEIIDGMYFHSMPMEGDSQIERPRNLTMDALLYGAHNLPEARRSFHGKTDGPLKTPNKRNAVSMNVNYEKEFKTRGEVFTGTPLIDRDFVMGPNFVPREFTPLVNTPNTSNNNQTICSGPSVNIEDINIQNSSNPSRVINNTRPLFTSRSISKIISGNKVQMVNASTTPSASCVANANSLAAPSRHLPANNCNHPASKASTINTTCPVASSTRTTPDNDSSNKVVTATVTTTKKCKCESEQVLTQKSSETVLSRGATNAGKLHLGNCSCISSKTSNTKLTPLNDCPCLSMLPTVSELDELEETEKGELNRCLRRWQICRRDIVSQMSKRR